MALAQVQGKAILLKVSPDAGTTKYTLVCLVKQTFKGSTAVNKKETQCGQAVGLGAKDMSFTFDAVMNTTPAAVVSGAGEASAKLALSWWLNDTQLTVYRSIGTAGADHYMEATAYLTEYNDDLTVGDPMAFSGTLNRVRRS
jgi:hypothetical protein